MADDDIERVADAADDVPFMTFVPRITGPDRAEMERLANQRPYTDEAARQLQGLVEDHEPTITAAQARELLDQSAHNGVKRAIRLVDGPDDLQYERIDDGEPLGPVILPDHSLEQALALACMRFDALEAERKAKIRALYPPRRAGQIHLGHAELHQLLGVPDGLRITGFYAEPRLATLVIMVEGDDLREVPEGCEPRILAGRWDYTHVELPAGGEHDEEQTLSFGRLDWWADQ